MSWERVKPPFPAAYSFFWSALAQQPAQPIGYILGPVSSSANWEAEHLSHLPPSVVLRGSPPWLGFTGAWRAQETDARASPDLGSLYRYYYEQVPQVVLGAEAR